MGGYTTIREVSEHFGLPLSTLHYWERRGLIAPERRARQRIYDTDQVYRIALINQWRRTGRLSIEEIAELLDADEHWRDRVDRRIADVDAQLRELEQARAYLVHLSTCKHGPALERCPGFRREVSVPASAQSG